MFKTDECKKIFADTNTIAKVEHNVEHAATRSIIKITKFTMPFIDLVYRYFGMEEEKEKKQKKQKSQKSQKKQKQKQNDHDNDEKDPNNENNDENKNINTEWSSPDNRPTHRNCYFRPQTVFGKTFAKMKFTSEEIQAPWSGNINISGSINDNASIQTEKPGNRINEIVFNQLQYPKNKLLKNKGITIYQQIENKNCDDKDTEDIMMNNNESDATKNIKFARLDKIFFDHHILEIRLTDYINDFEISVSLYYPDFLDLTIECADISDEMMDAIENLVKLFQIDKNEFTDENDKVVYGKDRISGTVTTSSTNMDFELTSEIIQGTVEAFDQIDKMCGNLDLYIDLMLESDICAFALKYDTSLYF